MIEGLWATASGYITESISGFIETIPWGYVIMGLIIILPPVIFFWSQRQRSAPAGRQTGTATAPAKKEEFKLESLAPVVMFVLVLAAIVTLAAAMGTQNPGLWTGFWILVVVTAVVSTAGGKWLGFAITYVALLGATSLLIGLLVAARTIPFFMKVQLP